MRRLSLGVLLVIVGDGEGLEGLIHYLVPSTVTHGKAL